MVGASGWIIYDVWQDLDVVRSNAQDDQPQSMATVSEPAKPEFEQLAPGNVLEWKAEDSPDELVRQAGPFIVSITKKLDDDLVAPRIRISSGSQSITLEGAAVSPSYSHEISFILNRTTTGPAVMLQSFNGGAHCCNSIKLAGFVDGKLKAVDLGLWDGDAIETPKDISRDGLVDFVMYDNSFLYAFSSYADSYAPPKIFNILDGNAKDVSSSPAFRPLFAKAMEDAGIRCRPGLGAAANGACPAFVAAAARIGKLDFAWSQMLAAYDATQDWDLPTGCTVLAENGCPNGAEIVYKSYPEALLSFLKRQGYVAKGWLPAEAFQRPDEDSSSADDWTA